MEKCKNVYFATKGVKFLHKRVRWIREGRDQRRRSERGVREREQRVSQEGTPYGLFGSLEREESRGEESSKEESRGE